MSDDNNGVEGAKLRKAVKLITPDKRIVYSCKKKGDTCTVTAFVEAARLTPFHDENLQRCTKELNEILAEHSSKSKDPKKELRLISTSKGTIVVWSEINPYQDDPEEELKILGIK